MHYIWYYETYYDVVEHTWDLELEDLYWRIIYICICKMATRLPDLEFWWVLGKLVPKMLDKVQNTVYIFKNQITEN